MAGCEEGVEVPHGRNQPLASIWRKNATLWASALTRLGGSQGPPWEVSLLRMLKGNGLCENCRETCEKCRFPASELGLGGVQKPAV